MDKKNIYNTCVQLVEEKVIRSKKMMEDAQNAANAETKSSAGDKYETARAMAQLEKDKAAIQLSEALKLKKVLDQIEIGKKYETCALGALVTTNKGVYFLSVSLGEVKIEKKSVFVLSPVAPLAKAMNGKKVGESFSFNRNEFLIKSVL